jgi:hypothetical protein
LLLLLLLLLRFLPMVLRSAAALPAPCKVLRAPAGH